MTAALTDDLIRKLEVPAKGNKITYDSGTGKAVVIGLGIRVTAAGAKAFIFNYWIKGRERRYTIGPYGMDQWTLVRARKRAGELRRMVDAGEDPLADRIEARNEQTVGDLCERFSEEHLGKKRPSTKREYQAIIDAYILPELKQRKISTIEFTDIDGLHRKMTKAGAPYRANRMVAVASKMFALALKWKWRDHTLGNPARGIERNQENKRNRYLSADELARLTVAMADHEDQQAVNILRMLLLTGARRGEVQSAKWDQFDLESVVWTKPGATTKQKTDHRIPLSAPALQLLVQLKDEADDDAEYVFPGRSGGHRVEIKDTWAVLCKAAKIKGARIHDLRHTYASLLVSSGTGLPMIGALLGHTQPATTARYAHLADDPLRKATERVGALVAGKKSGKVMQFGRGR